MAIDLENDTTSNVQAAELWRIAETGDVRGLKRTLMESVDVNATNAEGVTALMRAAAHGHSEMVEALVGRGADVNLVRSDGFNALTLAAFFGHGDVVQILVEHGADPAMATRWGTSADMWASARSFPEVAEYLGQARGNTNTQDASAIQADSEAPTDEERLSLQTEDSDEELVAKQVEDEEPISHESEDDIEEEVMAEADHDEEVTLKGKDYTAKDDWTGPMLSPAAVPPTPATPRQPAVQQLVVQQSAVHLLKDPPDIWDLVPEQPAHFQAGATFISRMTSKNSKLFMLTLAVMFVCGIATFGVLKLSQAVRNQPIVQAPAEHHEPPSAVITATPVAAAVTPPVEKPADSPTADSVESRQPTVAENRKSEDNGTAAKSVQPSETASPKITVKANAVAKSRPPKHTTAKHQNVASADFHPARKVTASVATPPAQVVGNGETRPRLVHARTSDSNAVKADESRVPQSRSETVSSKVIGSAPKTSSNTKSKVIRWP